MIGTGIGLLIAGLASATASTAAAKIGSHAAKKAGDQQAQSADEALAYEKAKDAEDRAMYLEERGRTWNQQDQDRAFTLNDYYARQTRLAPYRALGADSVAALNTGLFNPNPAVSYKVPVLPETASVADLARQR